MDAPWSLRAATAADHGHFVRFFAELGLPDPVPDATKWEAEIMPCALFLEHAGAPIAYGMAKALGETGYVHHVVVDPARRGQGVGRAVMAALAERLRGAGCARWCLNVRADNAPAIRLYEGCGFRSAYLSTALQLGWDRVAALPRDAEEVEHRFVDAAEDAALEAAFGIVSGRLRGLRRSGGRVLVRLVDPARPEEVKVGVAAFDPGFPGAYPFAVARPALAAPMLDALRPHARPEHAYLRLVVEGDPALDAALRAAGAVVVVEMLHMRGEIPERV